MSPIPARAWAVLFAVLVAVPAAGASHDPLVVHKPELWAAAAEWRGTNELAPTQACVSVHNFAPTGEGRAGSYTVGIRVDRESQGTKQVYREAQLRSAKFIAGGESEDFCWTFELPMGFYRAYATVDVHDEVDEDNETNNVQVRGSLFFVRSRPLPDLTPYSSTVQPRDGVTGIPQQFRFLVYNRGDAPSDATTARLVDDAGLNLTLDVPAIAAGAVAEVSSRVMPDDRPVGRFTARLLVDPDNAVHERVETNNAIAHNYSVLPHPMPDLRVKNATLQGRLDEHRTLTLEAVVANAGNRTADGVKVRVYDGTDFLANGSVEGGILVGRTALARATFNLTAGNHTLYVLVDPDFAIAELDESNNGYELNVTIAPLPAELYRPNLVVERFSALPLDPAPNESVAMSAYLRNDGELPSNATVARFLVDGRTVAELPVPALAPGRYHHARFAWANHTQGAHAIRVLVDPADVVREIDERDNDQLLFVTLVAPRPPAPVGPPAPGGDETPPATPTPPAGGEDEPIVPASTPDPRIEVAQVAVGTRSVAGGVKGTITTQLRNPLLEPVGRFTLAFKVDGETLKEILVDGIPAAGSVARSSGELDLPPGAHEVTVEARIAGERPFVATASDRYDTPAGEKLVPGAPLAAALLLVAALAAIRRKKADD